MVYRLGAFLVAESVSVDQSGRDTITGVIRSVEANTVQSVSIYAEFFVSAESDGGHSLVSVRVVGPDGATSDLFRNRPVEFRSAEPSMTVVLRGRLEVRKHGLYEIQLLVDGQVVGDRPLLVFDPTS